MTTASLLLAPLSVFLGGEAPEVAFLGELAEALFLGDEEEEPLCLWVEEEVVSFLDEELLLLLFLVARAAGVVFAGWSTLEDEDFLLSTFEDVDVLESTLESIDVLGPALVVMEEEEDVRDLVSPFDEDEDAEG